MNDPKGSVNEAAAKLATKRVKLLQMLTKKICKEKIESFA